jgi:hypothetical protein
MCLFNQSKYVFFAIVFSMKGDKKCYYLMSHEGNCICISFFFFEVTKNVIKNVLLKQKKIFKIQLDSFEMFYFFTIYLLIICKPLL